MDEKERELQELKRQLDAQILSHYLEIDDKGNLVNPPSTDDELYEFIDLAFNIKIPRKQIEPGHASPFQFIADLFFERVKNALAFAGRNGGKTANTAILNFIDMFFKPGCEVASAGSVKDQAKKCYRYFQEFLELQWFKDFCKKYKRVTGRTFVTKAIQEETKFANGSVQQILTATQKGLRSPHPHKARIDEIDEIEWGILQAGLSMARSAKGIKGQNVFTSTRQHQDGSMQRLLDTAEEKGITVYEWNVWETVERCPRRCIADPEHGDCPIYTFCKGKAHDCAGFYKIEDFIDKTRVLDREAFETEWLNKRPARSKLVYSMFDTTKHVITPRKLWELTRFSAPQITWPRISGIDFGSSPGHPFVYVKLCQLPNGVWLIFHEYVAEQKLLHDHASRIKGSPFWMPNEYCYSDWAGQERIELKNLRVRTRRANKEVSTGIDYVASLLRGFPPREVPMLYVWHECKFVISEFGKYRWPITPDGRPDRTGKPMKRDDHSMDAVRYALYTHKKAPGQKYRTTYIEGI